MPYRGTQLKLMETSMRASFEEVFKLLRSKHSSVGLHGVNASSSPPPAGMAGAEELLHKVLQKLEEQSLAMSCQNLKIDKQSEMLERQAAEIASMRSALSSPGASNTVRGEYSEGRANVPANLSQSAEKSSPGNGLLNRADVLPYVRSRGMGLGTPGEVVRNGNKTSPCLSPSEVPMSNLLMSAPVCVCVCVLELV
jgi:hypothetical protein